jgi:hypothetical protein
VGIRLHSFRDCPLDVWPFSTTMQHRICHRSGRLDARVGYTLVFKLYHYPSMQSEFPSALASSGANGIRGVTEARQVSEDHVGQNVYLLRRKRAAPFSSRPHSYQYASVHCAAREFLRGIGLWSYYF